MNDVGKYFIVERVVMAAKPPWTDYIGHVGRVTAVYPSTLKPACDGLDLEFNDGVTLMYAREDLGPRVTTQLANCIANLEDEITDLRAQVARLTAQLEEATHA